MQIELSSSARPLNQYPQYWAECFGTAPYLPMSRAEMDQLGWDSCDVIIVTGDAYVDHPSFGMAVIGRLLEAQGFRVGIIAQPDWHSADAFRELGQPNLFFGVTAGNMDSMINRYTADRKIRNDDAYSPDDIGGRRPDRCSIVYAQRCREAYRDTPIVIGGIEASLRRIAHYDYWQDKVRHSILADAKADLLLYGNAERAIVEIAHRLARGDAIDTITDLRGSAFFVDDLPTDWRVIDSTNVDKPGRVEQPLDFNHLLHTDEVGLDCVDCHRYALSGVRATIPNIEVCADCPDVAAGDSANELKLVEHVESGESIPWRKVYRVPDDVYFSHRRHTRLVDAARVELDPVPVAAKADEGRAAQIPNRRRRLAARHALRHLDDGALGVAVEQEIRLRVQQHAAAHLLRPVVVVGDAPQRGLDAADDHGGAGAGLAHPL